MAIFTRGDVNIYYEEYGSGFPVLLIAPGGMRSEMTFWARTPWNPIEQLSSKYRVIAMDQRNAGHSTAPIRATDNWPVYTEDQLALMDHLGIDRFHVAGMCIGGSYIMALSKAAPQRVASGVVFQTIGLDGNRQAFYDMFDSWRMSCGPKGPMSILARGLPSVTPCTAPTSCSPALARRRRLAPRRCSSCSVTTSTIPRRVRATLLH